MSKEMRWLVFTLDLKSPHKCGESDTVSPNTNRNLETLESGWEMTMWTKLIT